MLWHKRCHQFSLSLGAFLTFVACQKLAQNGDVSGVVGPSQQGGNSGGSTVGSTDVDAKWIAGAFSPFYNPLISNAAHNGTINFLSQYNPANGFPAYTEYARRSPNFAWSGSEVIIGDGVYWGFDDCRQPPGFDGILYNPKSDSWRSMASTGQPNRTYEGASTWAAKGFFIWGGRRPCVGTPDETSQAELYDPSTDKWTTSTVSFSVHPPHNDDLVVASPTVEPRGRLRGKAAFVSSKVILWGGNSVAPVDDQGRLEVYQGANVVSLDDNYAPISGTAIPADQAKVYYSSAGHIYDPVANTWQAIGMRKSNRAANARDGTAPAGRAYFAFASNSSQIFIWGGNNDPQTPWAPAVATIFGSGAVYDYTHDTWSATPASGAPSPRNFPLAYWDENRSRFVVMGGRDQNGLARCDGASYDPSARVWEKISAIEGCKQINSVVVLADKGNLPVLQIMASDRPSSVTLASSSDYRFDNFSDEASAPAFDDSAVFVSIGDAVMAWGFERVNASILPAGIDWSNQAYLYRDFP